VITALDPFQNPLESVPEDSFNITDEGNGDDGVIFKFANISSENGTVMDPNEHVTSRRNPERKLGSSIAPTSFFDGASPIIPLGKTIEERKVSDAAATESATLRDTQNQKLYESSELTSSDEVQRDGIGASAESKGSNYIKPSSLNYHNNVERIPIQDSGNGSCGDQSYKPFLDLSFKTEMISVTNSSSLTSGYLPGQGTVALPLPNGKDSPYLSNHGKERTALTYPITALK